MKVSTLKDGKIVKEDLSKLIAEHLYLSDSVSWYICVFGNKLLELEAEITKLKLTMELHAGDCCSLNNEVELFRGHWEDAEKRCDELQAKVLLSESQNYCKMCGNILDGYVPPKEIKCIRE